MNWRYRILGAHVHINVYMNGALCGRLCFSVEEFREFKHESQVTRIGDVQIQFIDESPQIDQADASQP